MRQKWKMACVALAVLGVTLLVACGGQPPASETPPPAPTDAPTAPPPPLDPETDEQPEPLLRLDHDGEQIDSVAFSPDGNLVATGLFEEVRLWSVPDGDLVHSIEHRHSIENLAFSPDGEILGAGVAVYGVQLSLAADGAQLHQLGSGHNNRIAFAPDGETVATGNRQGIVWTWQVETGEQLDEWQVEESAWLTSLTYSPDGDVLAAGHYDGYVHIWATSDGALRTTLEPQTEYCSATQLDFSTDGELLAMAGARQGLDHVVRLWRVADGEPARDLPLTRAANSVAFSPDGQLVAAGTNDGVTVWQTSDWSVVATMAPLNEDGEPDWVQAVAFSPDSGLLATATRNGVLYLWEV